MNLTETLKGLDEYHLRCLQVLDQLMGSEAPERAAAMHSALHQLWSFAAGRPSYDKAPWRAIDEQLHAMGITIERAPRMTREQAGLALHHLEVLHAHRALHAVSQASKNPEAQQASGQTPEALDALKAHYEKALAHHTTMLERAGKGMNARKRTLLLAKLMQAMPRRS